MIDYRALSIPFDRKDWEWRVERAGITNGNPWCLIVPYIQNRAIQERLDSVCSPQNWQNTFVQWREESQLCGISIYDDEKKDWVTKWDGAGDTQFESIKGGLSASMKRAAVQWGIGRHLYEESEVYVECSLDRIKGWNKTTTKDKKDIYWNPNDPKITGKKGKSHENESPEFVQELEAIQKIKVLGESIGISPEKTDMAFKQKYGADLNSAPLNLIQKAIEDFYAKHPSSR